MANELKHGTVGTELTQAEWEAIGAHVFSSQAAGDIMYASSTSQLTRLGKGADNTVLHLASGIPAWSATLAGLTLTTPTISSTGFANATHAHAASNSGGALTYLGTIATGVWQGTDVGVAYGGTGVSTLTDGGVLLGSGASAITAMAVLTDGQMIVGNGSTDPVAESGATLRTSIGVGTGDSPQFTDLTVSDDLTLNSDSAVFNMGAGNDFTITHDGTTGASIAGNPLVLTMTDNVDPALSVKEGSNEYLVFDTTNGTEGIGIGRGPTDSSRLLVDWPAISTSATGTYIKNNFRGNNGPVTMGDDLTTMVTVAIHEPNVTLNGNTLTNAASLYIGNVATEAANNYAIWVDTGTSRFDGDIDMNVTGTIKNVGASGNDWTTSGITVVSSVDSSAVADAVTFGGYDIGAGNTVIALSQETAVASDTDETKFSHKMQVRINGSTYYIMLTNS